MKRAFVVVTLLVVLSLSLGGSGSGAGYGGRYEHHRLFSEVFDKIEREYYKPVPPRDLIYSAIRGMLRERDAHSAFLEPESFKEMQVETSGTFGGLGVEITVRDGVLTVIAPIDDTPAQRAGLRSGDRIVRIEGLPTKDMQLADAVRRLRGRPGTKVTIGVAREGWPEPKDIPIVREQIQVQSARSHDLGQGVAYVRLRQFQERTAEDLEKALERFERDGMTGLVLDVRDNPGGLLGAAVDVTGKFVPSGTLVVQTEGRDTGRDAAQTQKFHARGGRHWTALPMVVLVNNGSASASEIVAGALQDYKRAPVVGVKTFGKGSVQTIIPLSDGSGLRLTTAQYFTPHKRSIHEVGVTPDVVIEAPKDVPQRTGNLAEDLKGDVQLQRALEVLRGLGRPQARAS